jgi:hypothetical protein
MSEYRYRLRQGGGKDRCPSCGQRRFVRYVDTWTGEAIAENVGRCDRENSCGYHLWPIDYFRNGGARPTGATRPAPKTKPEPSFISPQTMQASLKAYERNNFCQWLCRVFGEAKALQLVIAYRVGTSKHWPGACVYWQVDEAGRIRRGKVMLYNNETGRRVKEPGNMIAGVHWLLGMSDRKPLPCLFGLHLAAKDRSRPVAVVESEKSAIIGAGFVPEFIWTATGGSGSMNPEILAPLRGREVVLFPDLGAFDKWRDKADGLQGVRVSDVIEQCASAEDRAAGLDVADYLLREH